MGLVRSAVERSLACMGEAVAARVTALERMQPAAPCRQEPCGALKKLCVMQASVMKTGNGNMPL